jgi:cytochrome c-type biogenesis protein CcmF
MIVELGHLSLIIALVFAVLLAGFGLVGAARNNARAMAATNTFVAAQFAFTLLAYIALTQAFLTDNFSVSYVAANSNSLLPWYYKFSAVWGAHEGSFLLWTLIMTIWTLAVAIKGKTLPESFLARALHRLRRVLRCVCVCDSRAAVRAPGCSLGALVATLE